jgi:hypothetical protein
MCGARVEAVGDATEPATWSPEIFGIPPDPAPADEVIELRRATPIPAAAATAAPIAVPTPVPTRPPDPDPTATPFSAPAPRTQRLDVDPWSGTPAFAAPGHPGAGLPAVALPEQARAPRPSLAAPVVIPRTPRAGRIAVGTVVLVAAVVLFVIGLADAAAPALGLPPVPEEVAVFLRVAAVAFAGLGLFLVLTGALYREHAEVACRQCRRRVVAWKGSFGLICPSGAHYARIAWFSVALTAGFWLALLATAGFLALWLAG